ncbi:MAG TPA: hypothetical protein VFM60_02080 [Salinimicrobium sp.]|nr:hypothetical protein [Salinimicrobium sp.]
MNKKHFKFLNIISLLVLLILLLIFLDHTLEGAISGWQSPSTSCHYTINIEIAKTIKKGVNNLLLIK